MEDVTESITGRVYSLRGASKSLYFIDIFGDDSKVQIFATANAYKGDFEYIKNALKRGDIVGVTGQPGRTKTGELSIRPSDI